MKKIYVLIGVFVIAVSFYAIYFDLKHGTLPVTSAQTMESTQDKTIDGLKYFELEVHAGDTLLSIIEQNEGTFSKPIHTIVLDFQKLNNGISPYELQIGKTYKFPTYKEE